MMRAFWRRRTHEDFSDEVQAHLELETERLIGDGTSPEAARSAARKSFGNVVAVKERYYEASRWMWLDQLSQDLRYGCARPGEEPRRSWRPACSRSRSASGSSRSRSRSSTPTSSAPSRCRTPRRSTASPGARGTPAGSRFWWRDYEELRERRDLFDAVVAEDTRFVSSNGRPLATGFVSDNYFEALAPRFLLGRPLTALDAHAPVVVLGHQAWVAPVRERSGGARPRDRSRRPAVRDRRRRGAAVHRARRVSPRRLGVDRHLRRRQARPAGPGPAASSRDHRAAPEGREPGPRRERADAVHGADGGVAARRARSSARSCARTPRRTRSRSSCWRCCPRSSRRSSSCSSRRARTSRTSCSRAPSRAIARSPSASRSARAAGRIVRQLLTEGLLIAVLAGAAGLALAAWTLRAGIAALFSTLPPSVAALFRVAPLDFDARVFLFALGVAAATTLVFALLPALQASRLSLTDALHGQRTRHGRGLAAAERARRRPGRRVARARRRGADAGAATSRRSARSISGYQTRGVYSVNIRGERNRARAEAGGGPRRRSPDRARWRSPAATRCSFDRAPSRRRPAPAGPRPARATPSCRRSISRSSACRSCADAASARTRRARPRAWRSSATPTARRVLARGEIRSGSPSGSNGPRGGRSTSCPATPRSRSSAPRATSSAA